MNAISVLPPEQMIDTSVTLPGSKSIANRALIMAALGAEPLDALTDAASDDVATMIAALKAEPKGTIDVGPAGTAMRFLTAYFAGRPGADVTLTARSACCNAPSHLL